jgi:hypothetical protein
MAARTNHPVAATALPPARVSSAAA